jgi:tetratricopeptide (TPR) repeat protein
MERGQAQLQLKPYIERGLELVAKDQIDEAIAVFNQGLALDPKSEKLQSLKRAAEDKNQRIRGIKPLMDKAAALQQEGKYDEAKAVLSEVLTKDSGNSEALDKFTEIMAVQAKQQATAEIDALAAAAETAWNEKRWFDTITNWNLVREIQPDHPRAGQRIAEAGAQLKAIGVPGLDAGMQGAATVTASFEKGLTQFLSGQTVATLAEWRGVAAKVPQSGEMLQAYSRKIEEVHAAHIKYHLARAKQLLEWGDLGRAMGQLRHACQVDPASAEARAELDGHKAMAEQAVTRYLSDAEGWEKLERLRAAVFCLERAYEIEPGREGLKQRVTDGRNRLQKMKELHAAMDRR